MTVETCVVDNRTFLLGLDELYRERMKEHERGELLDCARNTAAVLSVLPNNSIPVEGYYYEDEQLTEYFRLIRALQEVDRKRGPELKESAEFARLKEVTSAPIFGKPEYSGKLLPKGRDPLTVALEATWPHWSINRIVDEAHDNAIKTEDFSLVGLGALTRDPVLLAALRESVVLYACVMTLGVVEEPERHFVWKVDEEISKRANHFIRIFNQLFDESLPDATKDNAEAYWHASSESEIIGRCVQIGYDDNEVPVRHYHWAINSVGERLGVTEFWDTQVWTTEHFREKHLSGRFRGERLWTTKRPGRDRKT